MAGTFDLFDSQWLTNQQTESDPRTRAVNTLQIHHTTTTSASGARSLMDPGGRTVSSNGLLDSDGHLYEVVLAARRAYASASSFDHQSFTVECVNTSLAPNWGISDATHVRLAQLAVALYKMGWLGSLTRAHIIGHNEVPGSYSTACPGPSMNLDYIVALANQIFNGLAASTRKKKLMQTQWDTNGTGYLVTEVGVGAIGTMQLMNLFKRNMAGEDKFNATEMQMMNSFLRSIWVAAQAGTQIDQAKFVSAIVDALNKQNDANATLIAKKIAAEPLKLVAVQDIDPKVVKDALDSALVSAIPRISAAIVKQSGEKLAA